MKAKTIIGLILLTATSLLPLTSSAHRDDSSDEKIIEILRNMRSSKVDVCDYAIMGEVLQLLRSYTIEEREALRDGLYDKEDLLILVPHFEALEIEIDFESFLKK